MCVSARPSPLGEPEPIRAGVDLGPCLQTQAAPGSALNGKLVHAGQAVV